MAEISSEGMITVYLNDAPSREAEGTTLEGVLSRHGVVRKVGMAVAVDGAIVRRDRWLSFILKEGMRILIIEVAQGG